MVVVLLDNVLAGEAGGGSWAVCWRGRLVFWGEASGGGGWCEELK